MAAAPPLLTSPGTSVLAYGNWTPAFFQPHPRSIGGIVAEVTIEESAEDDLQITEHPVEQGAPIADHAFKRPSTVTIRAGWSRQRSKDLSAETGVYGLLLSWQASLLPFNLITGKRSYSNMLIERLSIQTDQHSEFALMATLVCRQVIIVGTSTTTVTGMSDNSGDHQNPESTAPSTDQGDTGTTDYGGGQDQTGTGTKIGTGTSDTSGSTGTGTKIGGSGALPGDFVEPPSPGGPTANTANSQFKANGVAPPADPPNATPPMVFTGPNTFAPPPAVSSP
jgi:hypothetical protein